MKRLSYLGFLVGTALLIFACMGCKADGAFVAAVDAAWETIGPEYSAYVEADETISDDTKHLRVRTARFLSELIEEAKR